MSIKKGRILQFDKDLPKRKKTVKDLSLGLSKFNIRSNEWNRLASIRNKIMWKKDLTEDDKRDLKEIQAIEEGKLKAYRAEKQFFRPASVRNINGKLYWVQNFDEGPIRELTEKEKRTWEKAGSENLFGYFRTNGNIHPFVLSGWDRFGLDT